MSAPRAEIYRLLNALAAQGRAIIVISSELPEMLRLSHRIAVMCEGRLTGILPGGAIAGRDHAAGHAARQQLRDGDRPSSGEGSMANEHDCTSGDARMRSVRPLLRRAARLLGLLRA